DFENVDPENEGTVDPDQLPNLISTTFANLGMNFRYPGAPLANHTDGNNLTFIRDGENYLQEWYNLVTRADVTHIYNSNWRIDNVQTVATIPSSTALDVLIAQHNNGKDVRQIINDNVAVLDTNIPSANYLLAQSVKAIRDRRFPRAGSNHGKFLIVRSNTSGWALIGSVDVSVNRLDDDSHSGNYDNITHEVGALVEGPAVADIEHSFVERWNDPSRSMNVNSSTVAFSMMSTEEVENISKSGAVASEIQRTQPTQPLITTPVGTYPVVGSHSVQVLRTYGIAENSYTWATAAQGGEFSIWASTMNAIVKAQSYIYIEEQTLLTFNWPPCCDQPPHLLAQVTDLVFLLGTALKRGVKVGIILAEGNPWPLKYYQRYQRHYSLTYLQNIANQYGTSFFAGYIANNDGSIYVHSKLVIADDEFALIGSANFDQRSMCHDEEIKIGVVDEQNLFVKNLRVELFEEHSQQPPSQFMDRETGFDNFMNCVQNQTGRLRPYDFSNLFWWPSHALILNNIGWPYAGPANLR
ncbi:MAG: phospholipase D-like domain-containing protein, partial [Bacteroidota bacterium]